MNTAEQFTINEWLSEYPEDMTYEEIIDLIYDEDESVIPWELVKNRPAADLIQIMYNTKRYFEFVTKSTVESNK